MKQSFDLLFLLPHFNSWNSPIWSKGILTQKREDFSYFSSINQFQARMIGFVENYWNFRDLLCKTFHFFHHAIGYLALSRKSSIRKRESLFSNRRILLFKSENSSFQIGEDLLFCLLWNEEEKRKIFLSLILKRERIEISSSIFTWF